MKVRCVVFSPSGDRILSGGSEDVISIDDDFSIIDDCEKKTGVLHYWDCRPTASGNVKPIQPLMTISGDFYEIYNLSFSTDGNYVISTGGNKYCIDELLYVPNLSLDMVESLRNRIKTEIILWNFTNGSKVCTFDSGLEYNNGSIVSTDGIYTLTAYEDNKIKVNNNNSNEDICRVEGHALYVENCKKTGDGTFMLCGNGKKLVKRDAVTNKDLSLFAGYTGAGITNVQFSHTACAVITNYDYGFTLWDLPLGNKSLSGKLYPPCKTTFSADGKYILLREDSRSFKIIEKENRHAEKIFATEQGNIGCAVFFPDGRKILSGGSNRATKSGEILIWDKSLVKPTWVLPGKYGHVGALAIDPTGTFAVSGSVYNNPADYSETGEIILWDIDKGKMLQKFEVDSYRIDGVLLSPHTKYIVSSGDIFKSTGIIKIWDIGTGKEVKTFSEGIHTLECIAFSPDGNLIAAGGDDAYIRVFESNGLREIKRYGGHSGQINSVCFSSDGEYLLSGSSDKTIKLWDLARGKEIKTFVGHTDAVFAAVFSPNNAFIISGSKDTTTRIWNRKTGEYTCLVSSSEGDDWIMYTSDGYWDSSRNGGELIAMVRGLECWNVDQFAVMNNRPDIIIKRLCAKDSSLIDHYYYQYIKRLKRLGLDEDVVKKDYMVPVARIIKTKQEGKFFTVSFELSDAAYKLRSYNIHVNDVPLFGSFGKPVTGKVRTIDEKAELTSGENKIEVSCMNVNGAESFRSPVYITCDKQVRGNLYFLGFGVSKYENEKLNLKYADKDVKDLSALFSRMKGNYYDNVHIKTYLNDEVTQEAIKKSKEFLADAAPDDTFVLFISGHGVHDNDRLSTYYFLTHNTRLTNLAQTAADFELIEEILQGIAPRNKLFLMDTCESGEIDDTVQEMYYKEAAGKGFRARTIRYGDSGDERGTGILKKQQKRPYLFEKNRYIYNDLVRRSGAIVFSSCMGGEFSYERQDIENGFFTEALLQSLLTKNADKNRDTIVDTEELREYVSRIVAETTNDLQHPTVDRDNLYQKFGFPLVKEK